MPFFESAGSVNIVDSSFHSVAGNHTSNHYTIRNEGNFHGNINADKGFHTSSDSDSDTPLETKDIVFSNIDNAGVRGDSTANIQGGARPATLYAHIIIDRLISQCRIWRQS